MYEDDTCLIIAVDRDSYSETLTNELQKVMEQFKCNDLLNNDTKTEYIHFGPYFYRNFEKGEHDLSELFATAHEYLFINNKPYYKGPEHSTLNKKG